MVGTNIFRKIFLHHPKYAVVDDRALVTTENWKPAGLGGRSSRGWGVVVRGNETANALAGLFRADAGWRDSTDWSAFRAGRTFEIEGPANGSYPTRFEPENFSVDGVRVLAAPDNAEDALVGLLDNATESIRIVQASVGSRRQPFVRAALRAAERGVDVRVLLSGAWYAEEDNRALAAWLNRRANRTDASLHAKVAEPEGRFEKIHAKGVVVDGDRAVVSSVNWNNNSARQNREVGLVLDGEAVAGYYADVFDADWNGSGGGEGGSGPGLGLGDWADDQPLPVGVAVAALGVVTLAVLVARRIRFVD